MALQWTIDNIKGFGGNPEAITIGKRLCDMELACYPRLSCCASSTDIGENSRAKCWRHECRGPSDYLWLQGHVQPGQRSAMSC